MAVRAFQDAGLRLIFLFLLDDRRVNETYRELANLTGISRGAIGYIMTDLRNLGYVIELKRGQRKLHNRTTLIEKWVTGFGESLRPKLVRGRFNFEDAETRGQWRQVPIQSINGYWSGEPAADMLTNYLRPESFALYSDAPTQEIVQYTRLRPDEDGPIELMAPFWNSETITSHLPATKPAAVPPLLVYADLIASAISRNLDAAKKLLEDGIVV